MNSVICPALSAHPGRFAVPVVALRWLLAALVLLAAALPVRTVHAQAWLLTQAERKAYLQHYAPVIMQRAEENSSKKGRDWISNYDFDRDGNFANNRYSFLGRTAEVQAMPANDPGRFLS